MDYEKKYEKLVDAVKVLRDNNPSDEGIQNWVNDNVPELKEESEDERIRKEIIVYLSTVDDKDLIPYESWIAWLEKQGKNNMGISETTKKELEDNLNKALEKETQESWNEFLDKQGEKKEINLVEILKHYPRGTELYSPLYGKLWLAEVDEEDEIITCYTHQLEQENLVSFYSNGTTGLPDFTISKDCMLFLYDIEKQGDLKSKKEVDNLHNYLYGERNVFYKVGDWIIRCAEGFKHNIYLVTEVKDYYVCEDLKGRRVTFTFNDVHKNFRLWNISDAKDGDVLCVKYGNDEMPFIFTGKQDDIAYCALNSFGEFVLSMAEWLLHATVLPSTKEQRDLLFTKMKESGYEWNADKKELNEIEEKPIEKVEPKFKVGDWVVGDYGSIWKTEGILLNQFYLLKGVDGISQVCPKIERVDKTYHLWSLKDAKDGDVLVGSKEWNIILMFRGIGNTEWDDVIDYHCYYDYRRKEFVVQKDLEYWGNTENNQLKPATKEQREQLFQKIKEAGYEWDAEKKELKIIDWSKHVKFEPIDPSIIEEKPVWTEEDEENLNQLHKIIVKKAYEEYEIDTEDETLWGKHAILDNWLKTLKERLKGGH